MYWMRLVAGGEMRDTRFRLDDWLAAYGKLASLFMYLPLLGCSVKLDSHAFADLCLLQHALSILLFSCS